MFYYVYLLESIPKKKLYIEFTTDLKKRFKQHNSGINKATKPYIPYKLIFYESFLSKRDAKKREIYLKSGYGLRSIKQMLRDYLNNQK